MIRAILLAVVIVVSNFAPLCHAQVKAPDEAANIRAVLAKQADDWNRGDMEAYATGYKNSPDTLFIGETVRRGYQQMLESYRKGYSGKAAMGVLSFSNEEVHLLDARFAVVIGNFHLERTAEGGGNADGIYSLVMEKTAQGWKIVVDHSSATPVRRVSAVAPKSGSGAK